MSAIAVPGDLPSASIYKPGEVDRTDFIAGASFHPRIQFFSDQAAIVKKRQFPANHFAIVKKKDENIDIGETFLAYPLAYRYKALDFREPGKVKSYYQPNSPEYKACVAVAKDKSRPKGEKSPCMFGAEFLLWVQGHGYATLLCSTFSLKRVADKLFGLVEPVRRFVSFGHKLEEMGTNIFEAPIVTVAMTEFEIPEESAKLSKVMTEFANASKPEVQAPEDDEGDDATPPATDARTR